MSIKPEALLIQPVSTQLNILMDSTLFGREFGFLVIIDSLSEKAIYHQILKTERSAYYQKALKLISPQKARLNRQTEETVEEFRI